MLRKSAEKHLNQGHGPHLNSAAPVARPEDESLHVERNGMSTSVGVDFLGHWAADWVGDEEEALAHLIRDASKMKRFPATGSYWRAAPINRPQAKAMWREECFP